MRKIGTLALFLLLGLTSCASAVPGQPVITYLPGSTNVPVPVISPSANPIISTPANTTVAAPVITPNANPIILTSNTTTTIQAPPQVTGGGNVTAELAILLAKTFVPPQAVLRSTVKVSPDIVLPLVGRVWRVTFDGANVSRAELEGIGWFQRPFVFFGVQDPAGIYQKIIIDIDAQTGEIVAMSATSTPVTADEALMIAKKFVPPQAVSRANITVTLELATTIPEWHVYFEGANVSRSELTALGWTEGPNIYFGVEIPLGIFKDVLINVDLRTGSILLMSANSLPRL